MQNEISNEINPQIGDSTFDGLQNQISHLAKEQDNLDYGMIYSDIREINKGYCGRQYANDRDLRIAELQNEIQKCRCDGDLGRALPAIRHLVMMGFLATSKSQKSECYLIGRNLADDLYSAIYDKMFYYHQKSNGRIQ